MVKKIPTDFGKLKNPVICIKHFNEKDIIRKDCVIYKGEYKEYQRKIPKLKDGSVPCIFSNLPSYLSTPKTSCQRLCDVEDKNMQKAIQNSIIGHKKYTEENAFNNIQDIVSYLEKSKEELNQKWLYLVKDLTLHLCLYEICSNIPTILSTLVIYNEWSKKCHV